MNRTEHLLVCLAEECSEVGQRVSKALRFGLDEIQRDQPFNNSERIVEELGDLYSVVSILIADGILPPFSIPQKTVDAKRAKIERYMEISRATGALAGSSHP